MLLRRIFALAGLVLAPTGAVAQPVADPALGFAESLFAERDYYRGITEYKRYLFEHPQGPAAPWVQLRIAHGYLAGGKHEAARAEIDGILSTAVEPLVVAQAKLLAARAFYLEGRDAQALALLDNESFAAGGSLLPSYARYLAGCIHLRLDQVDASRQAFLDVSANHPLTEQAAFLAVAVPQSRDLPRKSPALAGVLSVIPGLGHLYLGEHAIALTAFAWNGLFGIATYDAFQHRSYGIGTLLAGMTLLWYSGTIYGAVSGAERYNRDARQNFEEKISRAAALDIPFPDSAELGRMIIQGSF